MYGLFTRRHLTGMLEDAEIRRIDIMFPLIGALMDRFSDQMEAFSITTMFTNYIDILIDVGGMTKRRC